MSGTTPAADGEELPQAPALLNQCLNISNYMYYGQYTTYANTGLQGEIGLQQIMVGQKPLECINAKQGLFAEAFVTTGPGPTKIVIGYEGTDLYDKNNPNYYTFTGGQVIDDAAIVAGQTAPSFPTSAQFAEKVLRMAGTMGVKPKNVIVTGHSLGAAEAEYVAAKTGLSGYTFGTPGIVAPANAEKSSLTNYVDYGDPVGNYANDGLKAYGPQTYTDIFGCKTSYPRIIISNSIKHYQSLTNVGPSSNYDDLQDGVQYYDEGDDLLAADSFYDALPNHYLKNYEQDLQMKYQGINLYSINGQSDGSVGADSNFLGLLAAGSPVCFAGGTKIRTSEGERAVETLRAGDLVVTRSGRLRPIRWLGNRAIDCRRDRRTDVLPVRVAVGAFGPGLPKRDLLLSPGHPVLVGADEEGKGGTLVPIMCLVNGTTIARVAVDEVTYWHVELDAHDILLAEGLPAESYIDLGSRAWFAGATGALHDPDFARPGMPGRCRPVATDGPVVEAERRRLDMVFATRLAAAAAWPSTGDCLVEDAALLG